MPYAVPRSREQQALYNQQLHEAYLSTRRVASPTPTQPDTLAQLKELAQLHEAGSLTATEFSAAKSKILNREDDGS
jgi:hypothetical protein